MSFIGAPVLALGELITEAHIKLLGSLLASKTHLAVEQESPPASTMIRVLK
jgi:hypothetical protein